MATPAYASPSEMMTALFGGQPATAAANIGHEKRLEIDLRGASSLDEATMHALAAAIGQPVSSLKVCPAGTALLTATSIIIHTASRVVITSDMGTPLHECVRDVLNILARVGAEPEWASFVRKNTASPWDARDTTMAAEYAILKESFAAGRAFIFGPVDADHYFYFVHDDLQRCVGSACVEADVQINANLYNVRCGADDRVSLGRQTARLPEGGKGDQCVSLEASSYESLRVKTTEGDGNVVTFETNAEGLTAMPTLSEQIVALSPDRFSVMMLMDPESQTGKANAARKSVNLEADRFPGYRVANRTVNTFEHGYAIVKASFVKE